MYWQEGLFLIYFIEQLGTIKTLRQEVKHDLIFFPFYLFSIIKRKG